MITQNFLDWLSQTIAGFMALIPPMPPEVVGAIANISNGMDYVGSLVFNLGILVPFEAVDAVLNIWLVAIGLWGLAIAIAMILRIVRTGS